MHLSMSLVSSESPHQLDGEDFQPSKSPAVLRTMIFIVTRKRGGGGVRYNA